MAYATPLIIAIYFYLAVIPTGSELILILDLINNALQNIYTDARDYYNKFWSKPLDVKKNQLDEIFKNLSPKIEINSMEQIENSTLQINFNECEGLSASECKKIAQKCLTEFNEKIISESKRSLVISSAKHYRESEIALMNNYIKEYIEQLLQIKELQIQINLILKGIRGNSQELIIQPGYDSNNYPVITARFILPNQEYFNKLQEVLINQKISCHKQENNFLVSITGYKPIDKQAFSNLINLYKQFNK